VTVTKAAGTFGTQPVEMVVVRMRKLVPTLFPITPLTLVGLALAMQIWPPFESEVRKLRSFFARSVIRFCEFASVYRCSIGSSLASQKRRIRSCGLRRSSISSA